MNNTFKNFENEVKTLVENIVSQKTDEEIFEILHPSTVESEMKKGFVGKLLPAIKMIAQPDEEIIANNNTIYLVTNQTHEISESYYSPKVTAPLILEISVKAKMTKNGKAFTKKDIPVISASSESTEERRRRLSRRLINSISHMYVEED